MKDFGTSSDPRVQAQLDRLAMLSVPQGRLGLETIRELLERLGNPHKRLPPVFHVAGTNGKGSTCAFLRAMLEADGRRVHTTTSPHLVRYNERIRVAGELIEDARLAELLEEVLDAGEDLAPSFFEVTIAAAFTEFARVPADACVVEVGLGGRFDATNVLEPEVLAACGIAALGIDHEKFLLVPEDGTPDDPLSRIAFEKAGITKSGCSIVTLSYPDSPTLEIERTAIAAKAPLSMHGREWLVSATDTGLHYADAHGELTLPLPVLRGPHQHENAALAVAMLRHQGVISVSRDAMAQGIRSARWPARLQRLASGSLTRGIEARIFLDGAHNVQAARALADAIGPGPLVLMSGILKNRDYPAILEPFKGRVTRFAGLPVPGHDDRAPRDLCRAANTVFGLSGSYPATRIENAFDWLREKPPAPGERVLVMGSLYLAGEVLRLNDEPPD